MAETTMRTIGPRHAVRPAAGLRPRIYLVRHARSAWNKTGRVSGQLDPPLCAEGAVQALALRAALACEPLSAVYTSTLRRAIDTALPTALDHDLAIRPCAALMELHMGVLQGRFRDERDPEAQRLWGRRRTNRRGYRIPGGESFAELEARVLACLQGIVAGMSGGPVLIVGHRSTNRVVLGHLMGWARADWAELAPRAKHLYEITLGDPPVISTVALSGALAGQRQAGFVS